MWARPNPRTPDPRRRRERFLVSKAPSVVTTAPKVATAHPVRERFTRDRANEAPPPQS